MKRAGTQNDTGLGFDGSAPVTTRGVSGNYNKNHWSGHLNDGRTVNMGRGPTKGNDGSCGHSGYSHTGKTPPTAAVAGHPGNMDRINAGAGPRGGGKSVTRPSNMDRINAGAGPRKGNQQ